MSKWISVEDRLPEKDTYCDIWILNTDINEGWRKTLVLYNGKYWCSGQTTYDTTRDIEEVVTHWMHLPNPPEVKE